MSIHVWSQYACCSQAPAYVIGHKKPPVLSGGRVILMFCFLCVVPLVVEDTKSIKLIYDLLVVRQRFTAAIHEGE